MKMRQLRPDAETLVCEFYCPACGILHRVGLVRNGRAVGLLLGEEGAPTLTTTLQLPGPPRCHLRVKSGRIQYLPDCGHALAGQSVDLPELPDVPEASLPRPTAGPGPGFFRKVINAGVAVAAAVEARVARKVPILCPPEVADERERVCRGCAEHFDPVRETCTHRRCGCGARRLARGGRIPGKLEVSSQKCPIGKWGPWEPPAAG